MASYLITGASRGIGFEFLRQLSADKNNTVIGLVRDKAGTDKKVAEELDRSNIHIIQGDMTDYDSLAASVSEVSKITGGSLDCLIANAASVGKWSGFEAIGVLGEDHVRLEQELLELFKTNVVGNIHLFNLYTPLISKGTLKKVITISSGLADDSLTTKWNHAQGAPYSLSKSAMNTAVAKFHAQHSKDGILFLSICPGTVDTGHFSNLTEREQQLGGEFFAKFAEYAPGFTGMATPEAAVKDVMSVINKASLADGYGGAFLSHFGTKQWL